MKEMNKSAIDWAEGLPLELLAIVAANCETVEIFRLVSGAWKKGAEAAVTSITIGSRGPCLPPGAPDRFPGLLHLRPGGVVNSDGAMALMRNMEGFKQLILLDLSGCSAHWRDRHMKRLLSSPLAKQLSTLSLSGCTLLTDAGIEGLEGPLAMPELRRLNLLGVRKVTGPCFEKVLAKKPLEELDLGWCHGLTSAAVGALRGMPLTSLSLSWVDICRVGVACLAEALAGMPLAVLNLGGCRTMRTPDFQLLAAGHQLKDVSLGACSALSHDALESLRGMPLSSLDLSSCEHFPIDVLSTLVRELPLTRLDLSYWRKLTNSGLEALRGMPLSTLSIEGCSRLNKTAIPLIKGMPLTKLNARNSEISHALLLQNGFIGAVDKMRRVDL